MSIALFLLLAFAPFIQGRFDCNEAISLKTDIGTYEGCIYNDTAHFLGIRYYIIRHQSM